MPWGGLWRHAPMLGQIGCDPRYLATVRLLLPLLCTEGPCKLPYLSALQVWVGGQLWATTAEVSNVNSDLSYSIGLTRIAVTGIAYWQVLCKGCCKLGLLPNWGCCKLQMESVSQVPLRQERL